MLDSETLFYLTAMILGLVLALQLTHFWWRREFDSSLAYWVAASWMFASSDLMFFLRPILPAVAVRVLPAVLVTTAYGLFLLGSQRTAGLRPNRRLVAALIAVHALGLYLYFDHTVLPNGRIIFNRLFWSCFSIASFVCLRRTSRHFWASFNTPAAVLLAQGIWLAIRILMALVVTGTGRNDLNLSFQYMDYVDVILFDGTLFVALLLALLHLRHDEITHAHAEMETLSGLLPVCAWCKKVRDDDGYWQEITEYFSKKKGLRITHGMCQPCSELMRNEVSSKL